MCYDQHGKSNNNYKHGMRDHAIYVAWRSMKARCQNPNHKSYTNYGGRGIVVCGRWLESFENFRDDMLATWKPRLTLDRYPDKNGNYEPGNCRWATWEEQNANRRELKVSGEIPFKGVSRKRKNFRARIWDPKESKEINLGTFSTPEEAHEAYLKAKEKR